MGLSIALQPLDPDKEWLNALVLRQQMNSRSETDTGDEVCAWRSNCTGRMKLVAENHVVVQYYQKFIRRIA